MERNAPEKFFKTEEIFSLNPNEWSKVAASPSGEIAFFQLSGMYSGKNPESLYRAVMESHTALSRDARKTFMDRLLKEMEDKNAISLSYLSKEPAKG
jgi:hypothetical protein